MKVRKAVIPAAGLGTRMLPATKTVPKEMLPMVDKPVIQYIIEEAVASGIEDILIVTNRAKSAMDDYFDYYPELETRLLQAGKEQAKSRAILGYWQRLDTAVPAFLDSLGTKQPDFTELYRELREVAETFFTAALPDQSPRGIVAWAKTMPYFRKELKRILGDQITEKGDREDGE